MSLNIMLREDNLRRTVFANLQIMTRWDHRQRRPLNCQGRRHATPWLRVTKWQRHKASCQDVLLHLYNSQTDRQTLIIAHILSCIKAFNPCVSKDVYAGRRLPGSIPERHSICVGQLWPFLYSPIAFCPLVFFFFTSLHQEAISCYLYLGFCRLQRKFNSGAKGLIKLLDAELSVTYVSNSFIHGSRNVSLA